MVDKSVKSAFSVMELIIVLSIILVIVIIMFFVSGKFKVKKTNLNSNSKYIFACYFECDNDNKNCRLKQTIYENNSKKEDKDVTMAGSCYFNHAENAKALLIATGAGSKTSSAQVLTDYTVLPYETITPGLFSDKFEEGITKISSKNVLSGIQNDNGLQYDNIISCELINAPNECPNLKSNAHKFNPKGCELAKDDMENSVVKILGCEPDGVNLSDNTIKLSEIKRKEGFLDRLDKNDLEKIGKSQLNNTYVYNFKDDNNNHNFEFNFKFKDSNYDTRVKYHALNISQMSEILSNVNILRQNDLVSKIIKLYPGAPSKNGAVVIMW